jgi:hypothetical protein
MPPARKREPIVPQKVRDAVPGATLQSTAQHVGLNTRKLRYYLGLARSAPSVGSAALVLPACNSEAMQLHLDEIATKVEPGAHAILILDQAGWHGAKQLKIPANISLLPLPPRAPELNSQENI